MEKLKVLDLFSGIGGFSLGLERTGGFETVAFCEIEEFPRKVLKKHWPEVPCYHDVRKLTADVLKRDGISVDVITGGFPCQDISTAGKQAGIGSDTRSGLWSEIDRLIGELRPKFVIVENVAALLAGPRGKPGAWFGRVLGDLARRGYNAEWRRISAKDIGADHERARIWILAYPNENCKSACPINDEACRMQKNGSSLHASSGEQKVAFFLAGAWGIIKSVQRHRFWENENSPMGMGVDDEIPQRLDRLRSLGNSILPDIPELIGRAIIALHNKKPA